MPKFTTKPTYVTAETTWTGRWKVTHDDGTTRVMNDKAFEQAFMPVSVVALEKMGGWTFEVFTTMAPESIQTFLRHIEKDDLALGLLGAGADVRRRIFDNLTERAGALLAEDVQALGRVKRRHVEEAQARGMETLEQLIAVGEITLANDEGSVIEADSEGVPRFATRPVRVEAARTADGQWRLVHPDGNTEFLSDDALRQTHAPADLEASQALGQWTFEKLKLLDAAGIQTWLRAVDLDDLEKGLMTASEEVLELLLANMSERAGQMLQEDLEALGYVPFPVAMEAQRRAINVLRRLSEQGEVVLARDPKEEDDGDFADPGDPFQVLLSLSDGDIKKIYMAVEKDRLVQALKGTSEAVVQRFLANIGERAGQMLLDDMEAMGWVPLSEAREAQAEVMEVLTEMADGGEP